MCRTYAPSDLFLSYIKTYGYEHENIYPAAVAALAAASLMSLQSCIGLDGIVEPGGTYWSVDDYIDAPGYWGPGFYGNGWGAPPPPPPVFGPVYNPGYNPGPVRPPQNRPPAVRPSGPSSLPEGTTPPGGGVSVPSGTTRPSFPTTPSGTTRPGNNGRPR